MTARIRTCQQCGRRWPQRHARFCGRCGAALAETSAAPPRRRRGVTVLVARALAVVGLVGLAVVVMSLDLARPEPDPEVALDEDEVDPTPSPLSREEEQALRALADPDRLRCEPRGCESWRIQLDGGGLASSSVVQLDNGLVLTANHERSGHPVLEAIDPTTGETAWEHRTPRTAGSDTGFWTHLGPGPHGALAIMGRQVVSIDASGEVVWRWHMDEFGIDAGELWGFEELDGHVVLDVLRSYEPEVERTLVALGVDEGRPAWTLDVQEAVVAEDLVVAVDQDGVLTRLDPATGTPTWRGPQVAAINGIGINGDWLVIHGEEQLIVDLDTGEKLFEPPGYVLSEPYRTDDGIVAVIAAGTDGPPGPEFEADPTLELVRVDSDGAVVWHSDLGTVEAWWACCPIEVDDGVVTVTTETEHRSFALDDGSASSTVELSPEEASPLESGGSFEIRPGVQVIYRDDGEELIVRTDDGEVTVHSDDWIDIASTEPLIVSDRDHILGIRVVETEETTHPPG